MQLGIPADVPLTWSQLKDEFNLGKSAHTGMNSRIMNLRDFARAFFVSPLRLNFKCATEDADCQRYLSGTDTRASTVNILWQHKGTLEPTGFSVYPMVYAGMTSILMVSPGRVLDLIQ